MLEYNLDRPTRRYKCTIAFCNRCKIIARSQESGEQTFKVHANITCALQMLYEDPQTYIVESNNSDEVHHHKRYRRILDFNADGSMMHKVYADTGFESDSYGSVRVENSIIHQK